MSEERELLTPDPPLPPGTPLPPDLDVDVRQFLDEPTVPPTVPPGEDVNPAAGAAEPSG